MRRAWWMAVAVLATACLAGCGHARKPAGNAKIAWITDPKVAFAEAQKTGKPVMMDLWQIGCSSCEHLDTDVWPREEVAEVSKQFVAAKIDSGLHPEFSSKYVVSGYPTTLFLTAEGKEIGRVRGAVPYQDMIGAMQEALQKAS